MGRAADARAADDPERHQPAALRDAQGDHGGEEERDQEGAPPAAGAAAQRITSIYFPEKGKKTQMLPGAPAEAAKELVKRLREEARAL